MIISSSPSEHIPITTFSDLDVHKITENLEDINVLGRSTTNANGITADWTASGIEFKASYTGAVKVSAVLDSNKSITFRAFVDGEETGDITFTSSDIPVEIPGATNASTTERTIRLVRIPYVKDGAITLSNVCMNGEFLEWNEERPFIEFVGDSITCGYGSTSNDSFMDGTNTFAYLTAEEFNADYSMVAISGIGVTASNSQHGSNGMSDFYKYTNYYRDSSTLYSTSRKASLVVVNLNTNDIYNNATEDAYKADLKALISDIRAIHGESVNIVWIIGHMRPLDSDVNVWMAEVFEELGNEGLYIVETEQNNEGGASHPNYASHQQTAETLISFINEKELLVSNVKLMSFNVLNGWGTYDIGNRDDLAADTILEYTPDVIGFQEFDDYYRNATGTALTSLISEKYAEVGADEESWNPIFYNVDTVAPVYYGFESYTEGTESVNYPLGTSEFRTYTWVVFEDIETRKQFLVFNTHLDTDSTKQPSQCAELTAKITELMTQYGISNVFLLGDLNSNTSSDTATTLFDFGFTDTHAIAVTKDDLGTFASDVGVAITTTYASAIDHVYCIGKRITVSEYKTVTDIRDSSDHCPICVTLKVK